MKNMARNNKKEKFHWHGSEERKFGIATKTLRCRGCGTLCERHSRRVRRIHEIGWSHPIVLSVTIGVYHCDRCNKFFTSDLTHLAPKRGKYTHRVIKMALHHLRNNSFHKTHQMLRDFSFVDVPVSSLYDMKTQADLAKLGSFQKKDIPKIKMLGRKVLAEIAENFEFEYDAGRKGASLKGAILLTRVG